MLEELLLSVKTVDVRESFSVLYELDASFENLRLLFMKCAKLDIKRHDNAPDAEILLRAAERCIKALRMASREFYIIEMLIFKARHLKAPKGNKGKMAPECPDLKINEKELSNFLKTLVRP